RAAVLASPVPEGWSALGAALRANPLGTLPALFGAAPRLSRKQLFSAGLAEADAYRAKLERTPAAIYRQVLFATSPAAPVGDPPTGWCRARRSTVRRPVSARPRCCSPAWPTT
ncbi:hypothetical protein AB0C29_05945, partial [Actinoplanes sp. NPDC048791]